MRAAAFSAVVLLACSAASAQFSSNFEFPTCLSGEYLTGQDGWAVSPISYDFNVINFGGNFLGIPPSAQSGTQFVYGLSGTVVVAGNFNSFSASTVHPCTFSTGGRWTATWDVALTFTGTAPLLSSMGGVSLLGGSRTFQNRNFWTTTAATAWNAMFVPIDATGTALPPALPDPAFGNLLPRHWYRESISWSFDTNLITSVSITDLSTGVQTSVSPSGWYLGGGAAPSGALPTQTRITVTGANGSVAAYDNFSVTFAACRADFNHSGSLSIQDVFDFLNAWFAGSAAADFNNSGTTSVEDIFDYLAAYFAGCP